MSVECHHLFYFVLYLLLYFVALSLDCEAWRPAQTKICQVAHLLLQPATQRSS